MNPLLDPFIRFIPPGISVFRVPAPDECAFRTDAARPASLLGFIALMALAACAPEALRLTALHLRTATRRRLIAMALALCLTLCGAFPKGIPFLPTSASAPPAAEISAANPPPATAAATVFSAAERAALAAYLGLSVAGTSADAFAAPSNAVWHGAWGSVYGASEDTVFLADVPPSVLSLFAPGASGVHASASGALSFGAPFDAPPATAPPADAPDSASAVLAPAFPRLGLAPPAASRFWHAVSPSNAVFTWHNALAGRGSNAALSVQAEASADGFLTYRYLVPPGAPPPAPAPYPLSRASVFRNGTGTSVLFPADPPLLAPGSLVSLRWWAFGGLDPAADDHDGDGVTTRDELAGAGPRTDPRLPDTDFDGIPDAADPFPLDRDRDRDDFCDGADPDPDNGTPWDDPGGNGLPDAWENHWLGGTNAAGVNAPTPSGFTAGAALAAGADPARLTAFSAPAPALSNTLACLALAPPFAFTPPGGLTNAVWERAFSFPRGSGWRQLFLSSAPDRAAPLRLAGLALEWSCGGTGGVFTAFPAGDSLRLPLPPGPDAFTLRLRASGPQARSPQPLFLLAWSPAFTFPGALPANNTLVLLPQDPSSCAAAADRSARPHGAPPSPEEEAATASPFAGGGDGGDSGGGGGAPAPAFNPASSSFAVSGPGVFPLRPPPSGLLPDPPPAPAALAVLAPSLKYGDGGCPPGGLARDGSGGYAQTNGYPLGSGCVWRNWHSARSLESCGCVPELDLGVAPAGLIDVQLADNGSTATATASVGGTAVWSATARHSHECPGGETGGGAGLLSGGDDCGCESACGSGGCDSGDSGGSGDGAEGDSHSSFAFRIPLGSPAKGRAAGFLWLRAEAPLAVTPAALRLLPHPGLAGQISASSNQSGIVSVQTPWRDIAVTPVQNGVRITVSETDGYAPTSVAPHTWTITNPGGDASAVRAVRSDEAGNATRDATYALSFTNVSSRADSLTGLAETLAREDLLNGPEATLTVTRAVSDASGELSRAVTVSKRFGIGKNAVLREISRTERGAKTLNFQTFASEASYREDNVHPARNGKPRLVSGNDRPWRYTAWDEEGRLTLALDQLDGSPVPDGSALDALDAFAGTLTGAPDTLTGAPGTPGAPADAAQLSSILCSLSSTLTLPPCTATVYSHAPADPADTGHPLDRDTPRAESTFILHPSSCILSSSLRRVIARSETDGLPAVTTRTYRLPSADTPLDSPACRLDISAAYASSGVPDALSGLPLLEVAEDGVTNTYAYAFGSYDPAAHIFTEDPDGPCLRTVQASTATNILEVTYTDAGYGSVLAEETYLCAPGLLSPEDAELLAWTRNEYDDGRRLLVSSFSDGTALTNAYDCCRLVSTRARDGTVTEYWRVPGLPGWSATAVRPETSLVCSVTEVYADALGRATNVIESVRSNGTVLAGSPVLSTATEYPHGSSDYSIQTDPYGTQTVVQVTSTQEAETTAVSSPDETTIYTRCRNGRMEIHNFWPEGWLSSAYKTVFMTNGNRIAITTSSSSDNPSVTTNGYTVYDYFGNVISDITDFLPEPPGVPAAQSAVNGPMLLQAGIPVNPLNRPPYSTATTNYVLAMRHHEAHNSHCVNEGRMNLTNYVAHFDEELQGTYGIHTQSLRQNVGNFVYFLTESNNPGRLYGMDFDVNLYIKRIGSKKFSWLIDAAVKKIETCECCKEGDACKPSKRLPDRHEKYVREEDLP